MTHPEPPASCPFFRVRNGELEFSPSAFAVGHDEYSLDQDCFPAKRYAAACVAIDWLGQQYYAADAGSDVSGFKHLLALWIVYKNAARAEMEASDESTT